MRLELRMKYLEAVFDRYRKASKESKGRILDEFCKVCGYNRKYAIWKLRQGQVERKPRERIRRKRGRIYDCKVTAILEEIWRAANYPWSVRLKEIVRLWLPWIRERFPLSAEVEEKLLSISASTIDRSLRQKKRQMKRRLYGRTKPGTLLRHQIPVDGDVPSGTTLKNNMFNLWEFGFCGSANFLHFILDFYRMSHRLTYIKGKNFCQI